MGGGLSKRKRVADYSPEFDVPIVYENVVHLQRLMDSYMPPAAVSAKAHITASRRSSKRRSSSREHKELVERLSPPKKEHSAASANRISQITWWRAVQPCSFARTRSRVRREALAMRLQYSRGPCLLARTSSSLRSGGTSHWRRPWRCSATRRRRPPSSRLTGRGGPTAQTIRAAPSTRLA